MTHDQLTAPSLSTPSLSALTSSTPGLSPKKRKQLKKLEKQRRAELMEAFRDPTSETPKYFVPSLPPRGCALPGIVTGGGAPDDLWAQPLPGLSAFWRERLGQGFFAALETVVLEHAEPRVEQEAFVYWARQAHGRYARAGVALSLLAGWWLSSAPEFDQALRTVATNAHGSAKPLPPYLTPSYPSLDFGDAPGLLPLQYVDRCTEVGCGLTGYAYGATSAVTAAWFDPASRRLLHVRIEGDMSDSDLDAFNQERGEVAEGAEFADLIGSMTCLNALEVMSLSAEGACGLHFSWSSPPCTLEISLADAARWLSEAEARLPAQPTEFKLLALSGAASGLRFTS